jgi:hypothetical protein
MKFRKYLACLFLPVMLAVAGCSAAQPAGATSDTSAANAQTAQNPGAPNPANQPIEGKLAMGTLKLEGSAQAITAEQAKNLLPLWKAVKALTASSTASTDEMNALYTQIQEAMTADQVAAIKALTLAPADMQALMQQYNIQSPQGGPSQSTTRTANSANQNGAPGAGGPPGGAPPDGGGPGGGLPGGAQTTPHAGQTPRAQRAGGGMNTLFVDPLITLLDARAKQ